MRSPSSRPSAGDDDRSRRWWEGRCRALGLGRRCQLATKRESRYSEVIGKMSGILSMRVSLRFFSPLHVVQRTVKFVAFWSDLSQARLFGPLALAGAMSHTALAAG